jgi:MarR family transcriptional repressor of mepA
MYGVKLFGFKQLELKQDRGERMGVPKGCENQIGPRVKRLSHAMNRRFMEFAREDGLDEVTAISGRIMGLIYFNSDRDIFQRDVEQAFKITRSSVTSVVQLMEKNGYISRQPVPYDARLKKLVLTDKGMEAHEKALRAMCRVEGMVSSALTESEKHNFIALCDKMTAAVEAGETEETAG